MLNEKAYHKAKCAYFEPPKGKKSWTQLEDRLRAFIEAYLREAGYAEETKEKRITASGE